VVYVQHPRCVKNATANNKRIVLSWLSPFMLIMKKNGTAFRTKHYNQDVLNCIVRRSRNARCAAPGTTGYSFLSKERGSRAGVPLKA
jgi:hypothetical protein